MAITDHDVLVVDQVTSFMSNDFALYDLQGSPIGRIVTQGDAMSRMFMGNRDLTVHELDNELALRVVDPINLGRDRFHLITPDGGLLAEVIKEYTLFAKRFTVALTSGDTLHLTGNIFEYEFAVTGPVGEAAHVSRHWPGVAGGLLGRERYVIGFAQGTPDFVRLAILGAVIALDLVRAKERRSGN